MSIEEAEKFFREALDHNSNARYDLVIESYTKYIELINAIENNPDYVENCAVAYNNRGNAYNDKGEYDSAIKDYDEAIRLNQKYAEAYNNRGTAYNGKEEYDSAIKDFDDAIKFNPNLVEAYNGKGYAISNLGNHEESKIDLIVYELYNITEEDIKRGVILYNPVTSQLERRLYVDIICREGNQYLCKYKNDYSYVAIGCLAEYCEYISLDSSEYTGIDFSSMYGDLRFEKNIGVFDEMGVYNPLFILTNIMQRIRYIDMLYFEVLEIYKVLEVSLKNINLSTINVIDAPNFTEFKGKPSMLSKYHFSMENIIYHTRSIYSMLINMIYSVTNKNDIIRTRTMKQLDITSIYYQDGNKKNNQDIITCIDIVYGNTIYEQDSTNFLPMLNELFNSIKHSFDHQFSSVLFGKNEPVVNTNSSSSKNTEKHFDKLSKEHSHRLSEIMKGHKCNFFRVLNNFKKYVDLNNIN